VRQLRHRSSILAALAAALAAAVSPGSSARAEGAPGPAAAPAAARFAIVVGVNHSIDANAPMLRYSDDDAALYQDLFRSLGARTYVLTRFDQNTQRLHPQAAAEAQDPRRKELLAVLDAVAADITKARSRGLPTELYFVYAGHGQIERGRGYLALEDARLYGADIESLIIDRAHADRTHVIVDACYSAFLAYSRGPGGERGEARGFSTMGTLAGRPDVGLVLSTSSARESHEWSEFQAGIFSHEIRSGLLGAADADQDGQVSYLEIAAFVDRANQPIPNERYRPDVYVKPPQPAAPLLDLRPGLDRRLELDGARPGHYTLEDRRGVRLADFHSAPGQSVRLVRTTANGELYLHRIGDEEEYVVAASAGVLRFAELKNRRSSAQARGAAHESFGLLFSWPFSKSDVDGYIWRKLDVASVSPVDEGSNARGSTARRITGVSLLGLGLVGLGAGTWAVLSARQFQQSLPESQQQLARDNEAIDRRNTWARWLYGAGIGAGLAGAAVLLAPRLGLIASDPSEPRLAIGLLSNGTGLVLGGRY
jgi:hypothetical protein